MLRSGDNYLDTHRYREGALYLKGEVTVKSVSSSAKQTDATVFKIDFLPGTVVSDDITHTTVTVGESSQNLIDQIDRQASLVKAAMTEVSRAKVISTAEPAGVGEGSFSARAILLSVSVFSAVLFVVAAIFQRLRPERKLGALMLGLCVAWGASPSVADGQSQSIVAREFKELRAHNCALNTAALVLRVLAEKDPGEEPIDLDVVARSLACGPSWEDPVRLSALQQLFESHQLNVLPFKDATCRTVCEYPTGTQLAVVHLQQDGTAGHFIVVAGTTARGVFVVDPGRYAKWIPKAEFTEKFESWLSGYGLLVQSSPRERPEIDLEQDDRALTLSLGTLAAGGGELLPEVVIKNSSAHDLVLHTVASSCSCVKGAAFENEGKEIKAGEEKVLRLHLDRSRLVYGDNDRQALLRFRSDDGSVQIEVSLRIRAFVTAKEIGVRWLPEAIDLGTARDLDSFESEQRITVVLPLGVTLTSWAPSNASVAVLRHSTSTPRTPKHNMEYRLEEFDLKLTWPDDATEFRASVEFTTTSKNVPTFTVPLRGSLRRD